MIARTPPLTQTLTAAIVHQQWSELVNQVARQETRVLVEKSGVPVVALVSAEDLRRLQQLDEQRQRDFALLEDLSTVFADVAPDEIEREVNTAVAEVRAEQRQRAAVRHGTQ